MYITRVAIICCCFIVCSKGDNRSFRIVGGQVAAPGQFPYQAALERNNAQRCGCVLINHKNALTAGHCIHPVASSRIPDSELKVRVGSIERTQNGQVYQVNKTLIHPAFNGSINLNYDIAMIYLNECITFTNFVQPIPIMTTQVPFGSEMVAMGWGSQGLGMGGEPLLRYVTLNRSPCPTSRPSVLCATNNDVVDKGVCKGDSGSSLVFNNTLCGIASHITSSTACASGSHDGFANVAYLSPWIADNSFPNTQYV